MCKLSAVVPITRVRNDQKAVPTILTALILENARLSNKDGWGIGIPATGQTYKKHTWAQTSMIQNEALEWLWTTYKLGQILIGHARLSTTGKGQPEDKNSHPFVNGQWMLEHNGHISNYVELATEMNLPKEMVVDSEIALAAMAEVWGEAETLTLELIQKGLDRLEGGYAFIVGSQKEPDRLYLIVGSNPLCVYENQRFFLVNTDTQLLSFVDQMTWNMGIGYAFWQAFTKTDLQSNHAYVLDKTGLTELGVIVPKVVTRAVAWTGQGWSRAETETTTVVTSSHRHGRNQDTNTTRVEGEAVLPARRDQLDTNGGVNLVNPHVAALQVARLQAFLDTYAITQDDLTAMLTELPTVVPPSIWQLSDYDLVLLQAWFKLLQERGVITPATMVERRNEWGHFVASLPAGSLPYEAAQKRVPGFVAPYYLNSLSTLVGLNTDYQPILLPAPLPLGLNLT